MEYTDDELRVDGNVIRFMWDYGVIVPLWEDGLLPEDPVWLRQALGLSDELIADLTDWGRAMDALDTDPPTADEAPYRQLDRSARVLIGRLEEELPARFRVVYRPWIRT